MTSVVRYLVVCGAIVWSIALLMSGLERIAQELAGKQTVANFLVSILANVKVSVAIAWGAAAAATAWGVAEHRLRKRNIKRSSTRIRELEGQLNPERGSSNISPSGGTNKEDK